MVAPIRVVSSRCVDARSMPFIVRRDAGPEGMSLSSRPATTTVSQLVSRSNHDPLQGLEIATPLDGPLIDDSTCQLFQAVHAVSELTRHRPDQELARCVSEVSHLIDQFRHMRASFPFFPASRHLGISASRHLGISASSSHGNCESPPC